MPAMQMPRCISDTEVMLSQASQLLHEPAPTFFCAHFSIFLAETVLSFLSLLSFVTIDYIQNDKPLHEATAQTRDHMMRCHHV